MGKLNDKIAVITGGNSGIGLATAKLFAAEGAKVAITGRRQAELDAAVKEIGHDAIGVRGDVAKLSDIDHLYDAVKRQYGRIDVLFANAGIALFAPVQDTDEAAFDAVFDINVKGLYFTVQKALPLLSDGAAVILTGSVAGIKGMAGASVYSATKAAVRSLARSWTSDLNARNIRINTLSPGPIDTPIFETTGRPPEEIAAIKQSFAAQVPLGRMGEAAEIAKAALFLASSDSSYVTGIDLFVDGGLAQV
jgi:NAD(P)-dependent dehydrogenase (short-subunit alcohol dehydrogenase family)